MDTLTTARKRIVKHVNSIPEYVCPNCNKELKTENGKHICDACDVQVVFKIKASSLDD